MEVWGVLYRLKRRTLIRLNASEGVPGRRYRPLCLNVEDGNGNPLQAIAYIADGNEKDGVPSLRYLTLLRDGASEHGLPEKWIAYPADVRHV